MERNKKTKKRIYYTLFFLGLFAIGLVSLRPLTALADPHAMFYTDRGQEQVFYNILAALNQADYVEPPTSPDPYTDPSTPPAQYSPGDPARIYSDELLGNAIATGKTPTPTDNPLPETQERDPLPRLRVRQVTSDNGDAVYRERLETRALAEQIRTVVGYIACQDAALIFGPKTVDVEKYCKPKESSQTTTPTQ